MIEIKRGVTIIFSTILIVCFAAYFTYYLINYSNNKYELYTVKNSTVDDDIQLSGYFIRDEKTVTYTGSGTPVLEADEGKKVSKNGVIAKVYADDAALQQQSELRKIQKKIDALNGAVDGSGNSADSLSNVESSIDDIYARIASCSLDGDTAKVYGFEQELNKLLCRRYMLLATDSEKTEVTTLLEQELQKQSQMSTGAFDVIKADEAGYFVTTVDGLEDTLTPQAVDTLTADYLDSLEDYEPSQQENCIGKLITNFVWYYAAVVDNSDIKNVTEGESVILRFPFASDISVDANVEKILPQSDSKSVVVLSSDTVIDRLNYMRSQTATLVKSRQTGLKVDAKAVRIIDGGTGVYAIRGSVAKWIPIDIVYSTDNYYLAKYDQENKNALMDSETIIVGGKDIYDGKQIT